MSHASAGNGPTLPPDPFAYFQTPEFHARMRNLNEAISMGMMPKHTEMKDHLGCAWEDFLAFARTVTDANGVTMIDIGNAQYVTMEIGLRPAGAPIANLGSVMQIAREAPKEDALGVIVPRLVFLRQRCDQRQIAEDGFTVHYFALNGLLCGFVEHGDQTHFQVHTSAKPRQTLMVGHYAGAIEAGRFVGDIAVTTWHRGWEDLLF